MLIARSQTVKQSNKNGGSWQLAGLWVDNPWHASSFVVCPTVVVITHSNDHSKKQYSVPGMVPGTSYYDNIFDLRYATSDSRLNEGSWGVHVIDTVLSTGNGIQ